MNERNVKVVGGTFFLCFWLLQIGCQLDTLNKTLKSIEAKYDLCN